MVEANIFNFQKNLNKNINDPEINNFLSSNVILTKQYNEYVYSNIYSKGISLCFKNNILDSVFLYNDNIHGFKRYSGQLPYNIKWEMVNTNIVEYLGDTSSKGGGSIPIWLDFKRIGLSISFLGMSWGDTKNPITFLTIYSKKSNFECSTCLKLINPKSLHKCINDCGIVEYCSEKCYIDHINYHLKYCLKS